ncbi:MAG: HEAT repeat domain-containing protein [Candidatus Kariarchaeaceae archaeon]|jgi:hypothetical protein
MNPILKILWKWQAKRKLYHSDVSTRYTSITMLGELGSTNEVSLILNTLSDPSQVIRNASSNALKKIIIREEEDQPRIEEYEQLLIRAFSEASALIHKLALIEVMEVLTLSLREEILGDLVLASENDLQYAVIRSLADTQDPDLLDGVLQASDTSDLVLRKTALQTWYSGISSQDFDKILPYCTPRLHFLIRATYELQSDGEFLRKVLSYSNTEELPLAKAYPDPFIRYLTNLLQTWEFDPEAYRSLHALAVPSYFTFDDDDLAEGERPFVIL